MADNLPDKIPDGASIKCTKWNPVNGDGGPCWLFEQCLKPANGTIPIGLSMYVLTRFKPLDKPWTKRHVGYTLKRSAKEKPLLLSFCPFCGENIDYHEEGYDEPVPKELTQESTSQEVATILMA